MQRLKGMEGPVDLSYVADTRSLPLFLLVSPSQHKGLQGSLFNLPPGNNTLSLVPTPLHLCPVWQAGCSLLLRPLPRGASQAPATGSICACSTEPETQVRIPDCFGERETLFKWTSSQEAMSPEPLGEQSQALC